jgi:alanyl-tRNA synthetase
MDTEKLYYADPFLKTFRAAVLDCRPVKNGFLVVLDRTAFYPEGGGQPADHGTVDDVRVSDVREKDGVIFHTCETPVEIGKTVECALDWERRFDHMQQHSGEHILSGILCSLYHCDNVGFHMGADTVTIDYNADISREQALEAERLANGVIAADRVVEITYPSREELRHMDYRSKKELTGQVRIVTFPEADCCACCGTHVLRSGQVELVKVLSCQKFRSGVRMEIVSGRRALRLFSDVYEQDRQAARKLSVKLTETAGAVERTLSELSEAKARIAALEDRVFAGIAEENAGRGDVLLFEDAMQPDAVRKLSDAVAHACGGCAAVFAGEDGNYRYALVRADGGDLGALVKRMNAALRGRGGGRGGFAQGSAAASRAEIEAFFAEKP